MFRKIIISITVVLISFIVVLIGMLMSLDVSKAEVEKPSDIIVSLGGGTGSRVKKAWNLYTEHYSTADKLIITAIPENPEETMNIHPRLKYLVEHTEICYEPVCPTETKNTWDEALFLKSYMQKNNYKSAIIVTHPLHSGRVKMSLDRVAHFKETGLEYTIVGDREVDLLNSFWNNKEFRVYALREIVKRLGYEVKALGYNIALRIEKYNE